MQGNTTVGSRFDFFSSGLDLRLRSLVNASISNLFVVLFGHPSLKLSALPQHTAKRGRLNAGQCAPLRLSRTASGRFESVISDRHCPVLGRFLPDGL